MYILFFGWVICLRILSGNDFGGMMFPTFYIYTIHNLLLEKQLRVVLGRDLVFGALLS